MIKNNLLIFFLQHLSLSLTYKINRGHGNCVFTFPRAKIAWKFCWSMLSLFPKTYIINLPQTDACSVGLFNYLIIIFVRLCLGYKLYYVFSRVSEFSRERLRKRNTNRINVFGGSVMPNYKWDIEIFRLFLISNNN